VKTIAEAAPIQPKNGAYTGQISLGNSDITSLRSSIIK